MYTRDIAEGGMGGFPGDDNAYYYSANLTR